jgi:hypothetical protein
MSSKNVLNLYPIDYPFETLASRVKSGKLILDPEFQRKYKWDNGGDERASRFIESCLMRIPLPTCYFAEDANKNHLVIDGVQRITTIIRFLKDEFSLEGLSSFQDLNGKKFSELGDYRSDIENYTIRCIVLRNDNPRQLIQDIFARLNQGAVLLSPQEIRHAIYPGKLDELLSELGTIPIIQHFGEGKNTSIKKDSREPEELVLRFFAFRGDLHDYEDKSSKYLDKYMEKHQSPNSEEVIELREIFEKTLKKCVDVFGDRTFVGAANTKSIQSFVYYDLLMWAMQSYSNKFIAKNKKKLNNSFTNLCHNPTFKKNLTGTLLSRSAILRRRKLWLEEVEKEFAK